jgi:ATPase subunit of ABC transporter with duplicated ATPase domains
MAARQAVLGIDRGSFHYGVTPILENVSFLLDDARTALVGENGAGKSTLLKCLTGELELASGHVVRSRGTRIGYVPQELPLALHAVPVRKMLERALPARTCRTEIRRTVRRLAEADFDCRGKTRRA